MPRDDEEEVVETVEEGNHTIFIAATGKFNANRFIYCREVYCQQRC
jgi:hypothetical protein